MRYQFYCETSLARKCPNKLLVSPLIECFSIPPVGPAGADFRIRARATADPSNFYPTAICRQGEKGLLDVFVIE